jgi:hypothetical protein
VNTRLANLVVSGEQEIAGRAPHPAVSLPPGVREDPCNDEL